MSDYLNSALDAVLDAASASVTSVTPLASKSGGVTVDDSKFQTAVDFDDLVVDSSVGGVVSHSVVDGGRVEGVEVKGEGLGSE